MGAHLQTQIVGPVQAIPPHWPYAVCVSPVEGGLMVAELTGIDAVAGADVGAADVTGAEVGTVDDADALLAGALPAVSPKKIPRPLVPM